MGGPVKGQADHLVLGDWNAACSMCGRKRKASEMVRNWQGLYRCPIHNETRQPQDFARGIKENIGVPWAQLELIEFTSINATFPLTTTVGSLVLPSAVSVGAVFPPWVTPAVGGIAWSFASGGAGITITSPNSLYTTFTGSGSGTVQVTVTSTLGAKATAFLTIGSNALIIDIAQDFITALNTNGAGVSLSALMTAPQIATWQAGGFSSITLVATGAPSRGYWVISGGMFPTFPFNPASPGLLIDVFNLAAASIINIETTSGFRIYGAGGAGADHGNNHAAIAGGDAIQVAATGHTVNLFIDNGSSYILAGGGGGGGDPTFINTGGGGGAAGWRTVGTSPTFDSPKYFDPNHVPAGTGNIAMAGSLGNPSGGVSGCGSGGGLGQSGFADGGGGNVGAAGGFGVNRNGTPGTTTIISGGANIAGTVQ